MNATKLIEQYKYFAGPSALHESLEALPTAAPEQTSLRFIAYYLPQFHAIPENDEWWGVGFTEWTNVANGMPRYVAHYQPRRPAALGFYDLGQVETIRRQAELAQRGGIAGFCIHDYWFSGHKLLQRPLELILANPDIDIRFCLNWANENWSRRWDGKEHEVLMRQNYAPGDDVAYAASLIPALQDSRYIKINGRPLIMIYRPSVIPEPRRFIENIRSFLTKQGLPDPYMVMPQVFDLRDPREFGMDAAAGFPPHGSGLRVPFERSKLSLLDKRFNGFVFSYETMSERVLENSRCEYRLFPGVCPSWDNEARRGRDGTSYFGSTPERYGRWLRAAAEEARKATAPDERIVFINAWNEWAEGAYLEPDRHFGHAYLAETRRVLDEISGHPVARPISPSRAEAWYDVDTALLNPLLNLPNIAAGAVRKLLGIFADRLRRK